MWQFFHDIGAGLKGLGLNEGTATAGLLGGGTKLLAIGSLTGTGTDDVVLGETYESLLVSYNCGDTAGNRGLNVAISDDGSTFGTAISMTGASGTAYKMVSGSATVSNTGVAATSKTVTPQTFISYDVDAAASGSVALYTTTGTEASENGITHTIRLSGSGVSLSCVWQVWGTQ